MLGRLTMLMLMPIVARNGVGWLGLPDAFSMQVSTAGFLVEQQPVAYVPRGASWQENAK